MSVLPRDDLMSLSLTLHHVLVNVYGVKKVDAAQTIAEVTSKGKHTIGRWRKLFHDNAGIFPDSEQGHYQRRGVLWSDEELCEAARTYTRQNAVVKGRPNMNAVSFTRWVNDHFQAITAPSTSPTGSSAWVSPFTGCTLVLAQQYGHSVSVCDGGPWSSNYRPFSEKP